MKVHILGASGSGTTTLGSGLGQQAGWTHLDADDFYWEKTNPPFQKKVPLAQRNENMIKAFHAADNVVVSGSMFSWGEQWKEVFDLVVFLYVKPKLRMERLRKREELRYGDLLTTSPEFAASSKAFLEWAAGYDHSDFSGRSLKLHNQWLNELSCPLFRLDVEDSTAEHVLCSTQQFISRLG